VADAKPASKVETPKKSVKETKPEIQFFGEGADKIKFEVDQNARLIRVYGNGIVLVDY
jgi:hypothetical protein